MSETGNEEEKVKIQWNPKLEEYLANTGEKAHCQSWLHKRSEARYSHLKTFIDLPVSILSVVIGALSIGSKDLFGESPTAPKIIGAFSILLGVLNSIGSYFAWSRRAEAHRISYLQYAKMYRYISVELSLPRDERILPDDFLKYVRSEYDRLAEISPMIPPQVIKLFNEHFKNETEISQPEEVNGLEKIEVYIGPIEKETVKNVTLKPRTPPKPPSPLSQGDKDEVESVITLDNGVSIDPARVMIPSNLRKATAFVSKWK